MGEIPTQSVGDLFEQYGGFVFRRCRQLLVDDDAAHDAVQEHEPDHENHDLDQLETVVVVVPEEHEGRQQQRPDPRVGDRAERRVGVEDGETVVGQ